MARARNLKPSFFTDDEIAALPPLARLLFAGLWCIADREGRLQDKPRKIKAEVLPYDDADVDLLLRDLHEARFVVRYERDGRRFIQVRRFSKHQNPHIKEPRSTIPGPEPDKHGASTVLVPEKNNPLPEIPEPEREIPEPARRIPDSGFPLPDPGSPLSKTATVAFPTDNARASGNGKIAFENKPKPKRTNGMGQQWDVRPWVLATALSVDVKQHPGESWEAFRDRVYVAVQAKLAAAKAKLEKRHPDIGMTKHELDAILPTLATKADVAELRAEIHAMIQTRAVQVIVIGVSISLMITVVCVVVFSMTSIADRCENWAACYRDRMRQGTAMSFEGRSRSNRGNEVEWLTGTWLGTGIPPASAPRDWRDADIINNAWQAIEEPFHQAILGAWYVRRWAPNTCSARARDLAGWPRRHSLVTAREFERILMFAHGYLATQLLLPTVTRRKRLSLRVRTLLGLELWWSALDTTSTEAYIPSHNSTSASA